MLHNNIAEMCYSDIIICFNNCAGKFTLSQPRNGWTTLVCLTFGDKLYAEHMTDNGEHPKVADMSNVIRSQLAVS